jgi:hypothetical protein
VRRGRPRYRTLRARRRPIHYGTGPRVSTAQLLGGDGGTPVGAVTPDVELPLFDGGFTPHPISVVDPRGQLLEHEGRLLRGIRRQYIPMYDALLASPAAERLFAVGLVPTRRSDVTTADFPLVLEHYRVETPTIWREWCSRMLRAAAVMVCDLNIELLREGYGTHDLHPWNVLFDHTRPLYVDFTAINPRRFFLDQAESWVSTLRTSWIIPLTLIALGLPGLARSLNRQQDWREPVDVFLRRRPVRWLPLWYTARAAAAARDPLAFFTAVRERLATWPLPGRAAGPVRDPDDPGRSDALRLRAVRSLLDQLRPASVLDIGAGDGTYSLLAARLGARAVALDSDEDRVNALYQYVNDRKLRVLPVLADFTLPAATHGRKYDFPDARERLRCDTTLLLGPLHRFAFHFGVPFRRVAALLTAHTAGHAVVEFVPPECKPIAEAKSPALAWYTRENLIRAMEAHFELTGEWDVGSSRRLLLFRKR